MGRQTIKAGHTDCNREKTLIYLRTFQRDNEIDDWVPTAEDLPIIKDGNSDIVNILTASGIDKGMLIRRYDGTECWYFASMQGLIPVGRKVIAWQSREGI